MTDAIEVEELPAGGKSAADLGHEALWFATHTGLAVLTLAVLWAVVTFFLHPDPESETPKAIFTLMAFLLPVATGFLTTKRCGNDIGKYVWISGLLFFSFVCVWVLDLPTGPGQCEHCLALEKLYRTFFFLQDGSGLMSGNGVLIGTWIPLSMFGYSAGARFAIPGK